MFTIQQCSKRHILKTKLQLYNAPLTARLKPFQISSNIIAISWSFLKPEQPHSSALWRVYPSCSKCYWETPLALSQK